MEKKDLSNRKNRLTLMREAFSKRNSSRATISVGTKERETLRDVLWNYPSSISNFFNSTSPISFILIFVLLGVALFSFFRSDTFANVLANDRSDIFVEGSVGAISSLNPLFTTQNPVDSDIQALVFEKFISVSKDGTPEKSIAKDWVISSDGITYDFTISLDHKWQDGTPLTLEDILLPLILLSS